MRDDYRPLSDPERAAVLVLSLGEEHATKLFALMDDEEIKELSQTMANLGTVSSSVIERLFVEFADQISATGSLVGTSLNFRDDAALTNALQTISKYKTDTNCAGTCGVNLIVQKTNIYFEQHLKICAGQKVPIYITSLGTLRR